MFTIKNNKKNAININKSKFFGYCFFVEKIDDCNKIIEDLHKNNPKASHICYAYIIGKNQEIQHFFDDNEPQKSSGFQIFNLLIKNKITNCLIAIVRYFGGVKLGIGLLSRTYLMTAKDLIDNNLDEFLEYKLLSIRFDYNFVTKVDHWIIKNNILIVEKTFNEYISYKLKVSEQIIIPDWINSFKF